MFIMKRIFFIIYTCTPSSTKGLVAVGFLTCLLLLVYGGLYAHVNYEREFVLKNLSIQHKKVGSTRHLQQSKVVSPEYFQQTRVASTEKLEETKVASTENYPQTIASFTENVQQTKVASTEKLEETKFPSTSVGNNRYKFKQWFNSSNIRPKSSRYTNRDEFKNSLTMKAKDAKYLNTRTRHATLHHVQHMIDKSPTTTGRRALHAHRRTYDDNKPHLQNHLYETNNSALEQPRSAVQLHGFGVPLDTELYQQPDESVTYVLIVAYQRTGSTFFGEIFNQNPSSYYRYEPLDGVYSAMYGSSFGWNIPSDITTTFTNDYKAVDREIPNYEIAAITSSLTSLFTCNVFTTPPEVAFHPFLKLFSKQQKSSMRYALCLRGKRVMLGICNKVLRLVCPDRFSPLKLETQMCLRNLHSDSNKLRFRADELPQFKNYHYFDQYRYCVTRAVVKAEPCMKMMESRCKKSKLRAIKIVRPGMVAIQTLMKNLPNLKVIHLVREPKAVVVSRTKMLSAHSVVVDNVLRNKYSELSDKRRNNTFATPEQIAQAYKIEAQVYCKDVMKDEQIRQSLPEHQRNAIFQIRYEDYVRQPIVFAKKVFKWISQPFSSKVEVFLYRQSRENSVHKWKNKTDPVFISAFSEVESICLPLIKRFYPESIFNTSTVIKVT